MHCQPSKIYTTLYLAEHLYYIKIINRSALFEYYIPLNDPVSYRSQE